MLHHFPPKMLVCGIELRVHKLDSLHKFNIKEAKLFSGFGSQLSPAMDLGKSLPVMGCC
jgi:hypothetical protein